MNITKIGKMKSRYLGFRGVIGLGLLIALVYTPFGTLAQTPRARKAVPRGGIEAIYKHCARCHKSDGRGGPSYGGFAADLRATVLTHEEIVGVVTKGRRNKGMPTFKKVLSKREIELVATFIETEFKGKTD